MLAGLARWCYRRRWIVLVVWILLLVGFNFALGAVGTAYSNSFKIPGAESQRAVELLQERFPERAGDTVVIAFKADAGVNDPEVRARMERLFGEVSQLGHVATVVSPYQPPGRAISPDGKVAYATVVLDTTTQELAGTKLAEELKDLVAEARGGGVQIDLGGGLIQFSEPPETGASELIGLVAAVFILLIAFGSVIAMGLPILTAIFGLGVGLALVGITAHWMSVPNFAPQLASMIGIGVGIDYALLIVTRYRESLHAGQEPDAAVQTAITTSGRAVIFAGITVVISMLGMFVMGFAFINGLAVAASMAVLVTMLASISLLPAILGFAGKAIDKWRLPGFHRDESDKRSTFSYRWSRTVQRRPWIFALSSVALLVVLAIPVFKIDLGTADQGNDPTSKTTRRAYDLLVEGFGPGFNGPLLLAAELPGPQGMEVLNKISAQLNQMPDAVVMATPPQPNRDMNAAIIQVVPTTSPQDHATKELISRLRDKLVPEATAGTGVVVHVGGLTAAFVDIGKTLSARLPWFIAAVLGLSFLLLMAVFRSLLVPLKAAVMNLLSIGAAYGVVVVVFQWGWAKGLFGVDRTGPIESFLPMMLFAILFGLSMDYEVFLLSRVREEYLRSGSSEDSVADGLAATARVITAAAAIMVTVFFSFVLGDQRTIKLFGLGLAAAIFIDATVVRMVLVPSTMELLGDANWWLPKWLDRILPDIAIEVPGVEADVESESDAETAGEDSGDDSGENSGDGAADDGSRKKTKVAALAEGSDATDD